MKALSIEENHASALLHLAELEMLGSNRQNAVPFLEKLSGLLSNLNEADRARAKELAVSVGVVLNDVD